MTFVPLNKSANRSFDFSSIFIFLVLAIDNLEFNDFEKQASDNIHKSQSTSTWDTGILYLSPQYRLQSYVPIKTHKTRVSDPQYIYYRYS